MKLSALLVTIAMVIGGCAQNADRSRDQFGRLERNLSDLRQFQAEQTTQIAALQSELRQLSGRLEELEFATQSNRRVAAGGVPPGTDLTGLGVIQPGFPQVGGTNSGPSTFNRTSTPPPIVPVPALTADEGMISALPQDVSSALGDALSKIRQGQFREALPSLDRALTDSEASYRGEWSPYVYFWFGVCHDALGDNNRALESYHTVVTKFPKHQRAPLALLREGSVFIRLRDNTTAKLSFQKLITDYPRSPEALTARERLKDI